MKAKKGKCVDCPSGTPEKYLIAKRCEFHYKLHRNKVNAGKKHNVEKREYKKELNVFFASQILQIPPCCEECGDDIRYWREKNPRMLVAHILPKRPNGGFPSVATHPLNRVFLCPDCHTNMDLKGKDFVKKMKTYPLMVERLKTFYPSIKEKHLISKFFDIFVGNNDNEK